MATRIDSQQLMDALRQERDELRLRLHLASMELQDQWHDVEHHWDRLTLMLRKTANEADKASNNIDNAMDQLLMDIHSAYQRIKNAL